MCTVLFQVYYDMFEIEKRQYELINKQAAASTFKEQTLAAMQIESDNAVTSLLIKQEWHGWTVKINISRMFY